MFRKNITLIGMRIVMILAIAVLATSCKKSPKEAPVTEQPVVEIPAAVEAEKPAQTPEANAATVAPAAAPDANAATK